MPCEALTAAWMDRAARLTALSARFTKAVLRAQELEQSGELTDERVVALYGLMMQATAGDCRASTAPPSKPSDAKGGRSDDALRWMAWKKKAGMSREAAMIAYVDQVQLIDEELSTNGAALLDSTGSAGYYSSGGDIYRSSDGLGQNGRACSVYKTGILYKQRDVFKGWRPRTFVLQDRLLRYYLHHDDPVARGTLSLEGCLVNPVNDRPPTTKKIEGEVVEVFPFVISHPDSSRTYSLAAKTKEEADEWITALRAAAAPEARRSLRRKVSLENSRLFKRSDSAGAATDMSLSSNATDYASMRGDGTLSPPPLTVMAPPHLAGKIGEALAALRENTGSLDKWEHVFRRHDVEVYRRPGLWQSVRGEGSIPHHPVSVLMAVLDLDKRREYDSHLDFGRRLQMFSPHTSLDYHHWKAVWPTKARDMYNVIHWQVEEGGEITIVTFSDSGKYPDEAGVIRAECILAGWVIRPVLQEEDTGMQNGNGGWLQEDEMKLHSRVSYLVQTDLKGKLPHSIRSHVSESQPMLIAALSKFLTGRKEYVCDLPLGYTNQQVEPLMDALNRRVVATEVPDRKPLHQTSLTIQEIQAELPPLVSAKVEDAVHALIEGEANRDRWEQVLERDGDRAYQKEADATDVGVLQMRTEGVIHHPPAAVLQAITTLDLVNIWSGTREFSTHDTLFNVHTWITYQRLQALFPMPTRDACQLVHWRVIEDGKRVVVVAVDDNFHPEEDGYVRAHVTEGWVLDSVDGGEATRVCCMYTLDIKGVMTLAVRLELSQKQGSVISCVRKFLNEYRAPRCTKPRIGPPLDQVKLTNQALEPLVIAWNRWSPTLVPARVKPPEPPRHHARRSLDGGRRLSAAPPLPRPRLNRSNSAPVSSLEGLAANGPPPRQQQHQQPTNRRVSFNGPTPGPSARSSSPPRGNTQTGATSASVGSPTSAASRTSSPALFTSRPSSPSPSTSTRGHEIPTSNGHDDRASLHATQTPIYPHHQQQHHPQQHPLPSHASVLVDRTTALVGAIRSAVASTVLDDNSPLLAKPALHFFALYLPVLIFVCFRFSSTFRDYAPVYFILSVVLAVRYVMTGHPLRPYAVSQRGTEWGQEAFKSKVRVRFPVEVKRIKRYIEGKQKETGVDVTVLHVAMRAVAVALRQVPELNGHTVMGTFFKSRTCDVSCEVRLKDGTYALIKVADADRKSAPEIARMLQAKSDVVTSGTDPFHARRQLILQSCPAYVCYMLDCLFTYLGAGLGLCIPALGVRGFPQGTCVVVTSPAVFSHRTTSESDFVIEPEGATGEVLSPILLTVGAISSMPKTEGPQQMVMVPVLDLSMLVRVQGAGLHHVRRLSDLVQKYMSDPRHLDTYAANNRVLASGDLGQGQQQQSPAAAADGDDGTDVQSVRSSLSVPE